MITKGKKKVRSLKCLDRTFFMAAVPNVPKIPNYFCCVLLRLLQKEVFDINETHRKGVPKTKNKVFGTRPKVEVETLNKV